MSLNDEKKWAVLQIKLQTSRVIEAFRVLRRHAIEPILIKGWAAHRKYPEGSTRLWFDIDLAVSPNLYKKIEMLRESDELRGLNVDFHRGLRHLDTLSWEDLFENSQICEIDRYPVRILAEEDHLRVLCVHWLNDGGENKDRLLDIKYAVENRSEDFKWEKCLGVVSRKRKIWIISTIKITGIFCGLDVSALPKEIRDFELPGWIPLTLERIWSRKYVYMPLNTLARHPQIFFYQALKRFPPNPLMALVGVDGPLDTKFKFFYQIKYVLKRTIPSLRNVCKVFYLNFIKRDEKE